MLGQLLDKQTSGDMTRHQTGHNPPCHATRNIWNTTQARETKNKLEPHQLFSVSSAHTKHRFPSCKVCVCVGADISRTRHKRDASLSNGSAAVNLCARRRCSIAVKSERLCLRLKFMIKCDVRGALSLEPYQKILTFSCGYSRTCGQQPCCQNPMLLTPVPAWSAFRSSSQDRSCLQSAQQS